MDIKGAGGSLGDSGRQMGDFDQVRRLSGITLKGKEIKGGQFQFPKARPQPAKLPYSQ